MSEAFGLLYGAAIGLAVGTTLVAFAARRGPRMLTGSIAGLLGYAIFLAPTLVVTAPNDVSFAESISIAAFAAILVTPAILLGAAVGAGIANYRKTDLYGRSC